MPASLLQKIAGRSFPLDGRFGSRTGARDLNALSLSRSTILLRSCSGPPCKFRVGSSLVDKGNRPNSPDNLVWRYTVAIGGALAAGVQVLCAVQKTVLMRQDVESLDLGGVAAVVNTAKRNITTPAAAKLLMDHSGLNNEQVQSLNPAIGQAVESVQLVQTAAPTRNIAASATMSASPLGAEPRAARPAYRTHNFDAWEQAIYVTFSLFVVNAVVFIVTFTLDSVERYHRMKGSRRDQRDEASETRNNSTT